MSGMLHSKKGKKKRDALFLLSERLPSPGELMCPVPTDPLFACHLKTSSFFSFQQTANIKFCIFTAFLPQQQIETLFFLFSFHAASSAFIERQLRPSQRQQEEQEHSFYAHDKKFGDVGLSEELASTLKQRCGFTVPSLIQALAIPTILKGGDVVVGAETGSGKTLAYLLPLIQRLLHRHSASIYPTTVILLPNPELCKQVQTMLNSVIPPHSPSSSSLSSNVRLSSRVLANVSSVNSFFAQQKQKQRQLQQQQQPQELSQQELMEQQIQHLLLMSSSSSAQQRRGNETEKEKATEKEENEENERKKQGKDEEREIVVLMTPFALRHALQTAPKWKRHIRTVVVDEADLMLSSSFAGESSAELQDLLLELRSGSRQERRIQRQQKQLQKKERKEEGNEESIQERSFVFVAATMPSIKDGAKTDEGKYKKEKKETKPTTKSLSAFLERHFPNITRVQSSWMHRTITRVTQRFVRITLDDENAEELPSKLLLHFLMAPQCVFPPYIPIDERKKALAELMQQTEATATEEEEKDKEEQTDEGEEAEANSERDDKKAEYSEEDESEEEEGYDEHETFEDELEEGAEDEERPLLRPPFQRTLIFANDADSVDELGILLSGAGIDHVTFHRSLPANKANKNLAAFKAGSAPVMVCTNLAARGMDFPHVDHVIQYHFADNVVDYLHRIGRTGRAGSTGLATSFYVEDTEGALVRQIESAVSNKLPLPVFFKKQLQQQHAQHKRTNKRK
ncbi:DEAD (Asp-Glu-Ala-Asp) box polypeptide 41 [Balamuthia mandrillaris]